MLLISVHLPKTAGKSFGASLAERFGPRLRGDYFDFPFNARPAERCARALGHAVRLSRAEMAGVECIHGHFLPLKYLPLALRRDVVFVTWLREPVDRLVSHWHYWRRTYDPAAAPGLHRRMMEERWTLERFCLGPELHNFYRQFLRGFPVRRFDFIGIVERYDDDFARFSQRYLGAELPPRKENVNVEKAGERYELDPALRAAIEKHQARDVALYRWARDRKR